MTKQYRAEVVGVGTELLLGQIANTNAQWISDRLANIGISVYYHQVVGDNLSRVKAAFQFASERSDLVFVTGGLGPTDDDLTREAFADLTNKELAIDNTVLSAISQYFKKNKREMTENNVKQAKVFSDAIIIPNTIGTAPGMIVPYQTTLFIFMPGVPREMKQMMQGFVMDHLKKELALQEVIISRMLRFIGIGESQLENKIHSIIADQSNPTIAPLASEGEVGVRLTAKASTEQQAINLIEQKENALLAIIGDYYYGRDEETIEQKVLHLLEEKNQTIAAAESLTGGQFADAFVSIPGAGEVFLGSIVSYALGAKEKVLGVSRSLLDKFGAVSGECAREMAKDAAKKFGADLAISFTGVAGPNTTEGKEVGTVYISICNNEQIIRTEACHFSGDRNMIRKRSVKKGLELLYHVLKNN